MDVVIHTNPSLKNQTVYGDWLKQGFERHGINAEVTEDRHAEGDIHVIQGPHYAYAEWVGKPNVLFLDRCFYGDAFLNVSLGWLNPDGSRDFRNKGKEGKGELPELKPRKKYRGSCIVFGDFNRDMRNEINLGRKEHERVYFRPHPAEQKNQSPVMTLRGELDGIWMVCDCAVGHSSTVLIQAEIEGLHVTSTDPRHVVHNDDREQWIKDLSWAQWSHEEIQAGNFWGHLCC